MRKRRDDYKTHPYGAYLCADGTAILFDRRYKPIVRIIDGPPVLKVPMHATVNGKKRRLQLSANAIPVAANTRIEFVGQLWFYSDATSPSYTPATRWLLAEIVSKIPALNDEIRRRAA